MTRLLLPFSWMFRAAIGLRNTAFDRAWLTEQELQCPVISVGNLTVGGTGKTPMVIYLAEKLQSMGKKPAILSRGYGRKTRGTLIVSDGRKLQTDPTSAGDEPVLMAKRLPHTPIVVDKIRFRGGSLLVNQFQPDVILLDDGFQYRWLHRDLDIVLLDAARPHSNGQLLPAGWLREPVSSLKRADAIVFTRSSDQFPTIETIERLESLTATPMMKAAYQPLYWVALEGKDIRQSEAFKSCKPMLLSGIARPDDFEKTARSLGIGPIAHLSFPDHQIYGTRELERIASLYRTLRADTILTTEKDWVKLPAILQPLNVWALRISLMIMEEEDKLDRLISDCVARKIGRKNRENSA